MGAPDFHKFLLTKSQLDAGDGFEPVWLPDFLFDFQKALVEWAVRTGRAAIFADCGLGKTAMWLTWAENIVRHTNRPVLGLTPLAVGAQTVAEAAKFGIEVHRSLDGAVRPGINITNYERLHYFNPADFAGVVCDESSILKCFDGVRRGQITEFMRQVQYRLLDTATAAPNDYIELGTSSEALGYLGHMDMLARFFKNDNGNAIKAWSGRFVKPGEREGAKWRFKGHAELPFWRWVCSWARAVRKPSDLGFEDGAFVLPPLQEFEHVIIDDAAAPNPQALDLKAQREERRRTIGARCNKVADLIANTDEQALVWCHLNDEADLLEKLVPGAGQVSGGDSDEAKEEKFLAFCSGELRVLVTKPKIGAWGLNFQRCAHVATFASHSFEQHYQGIRRCWRFGQTRPVRVDLVSSDAERSVLANLQRKQVAADRMFANLIAEMNGAIAVDRAVRFPHKEQLPSWL